MNKKTYVSPVMAVVTVELERSFLKASVIDNKKEDSVSIVEQSGKGEFEFGSEGHEIQWD